MKQSGDLIRLVIPRNQFPENGFISRKFSVSDIVAVEISRPCGSDIRYHLQVNLDAVLIDYDEDSHRVGCVREKHGTPVTADQSSHLLRIARDTDIHIGVARCGSVLKRTAEPDVDLIFRGKFSYIPDKFLLIQHWLPHLLRTALICVIVPHESLLVT